MADLMLVIHWIWKVLICLAKQQSRATQTQMHTLHQHIESVTGNTVGKTTMSGHQLMTESLALYTKYQAIGAQTSSC